MPVLPFNRVITLVCLLNQKRSGPYNLAIIATILFISLVLFQLSSLQNYVVYL